MDERKTHPKEKQRTKEKLKNPKEEQGTKEKDIASAVFRNEDIAQKKASIFFGKELLSLYGISGKIVSAAPTELADITISNLYQDYNYVMEDGSWKHLEFESTDIDEDDLRRFRAYEALASYQYKVDITTYVICSAKVKRPHCKLQSGLSTYQIVPICLGDRDAGILIKTLKEKQRQGDPVPKSDLVQLALCPIMGGSISQFDRIKAALELIQNHVFISQEEKETMVSVLYVLADKFLEPTEMKMIKGVIKMTRLGKMIFEDGVSQGLSQGLSQGYHATIAGIVRRKMQEGIASETIAKFLDLDEGYIRKVYDLLRESPEQSDLEAAQKLAKETDQP